MTPTEEAQWKVLHLLQQESTLTQRQLAERLGVSLGKTNYLLRALIEKGAIKSRNFRNSDNKLAYAYLLTPAGLARKAALTQRYLQRKSTEYEALRAEIEALTREVRADATAQPSSRSEA